jgi:sugar transferase (PEP-CTERM/EpsH1 system associated)
MKILFLTSRLPHPPHRGDRLRTHEFLRRLSRDHEIRLFSFVESVDEAARASALAPFARVDTVLLPRHRSWWNMASHPWSRLPFQALYYRSAEMAALVRRVTAEEPFDLIYTHLFRMVPFVPEDPGAFRVLDLTDCISHEISLSLPYRPWPMRLPFALEAARVRRYEALTARAFDEVWTISEADRKGILDLAPGAPVEVVPNGVDESLYAVTPGAESPRLVFLGNFSVPHNIDAARHLVNEVMPRVRALVPDAVLDLVGADPVPAVLRLDGRQGTTVVGPVPDLGRVFARTAVFVAPLRFASGVQNKVLEAMAAGVPVVTSSLGHEGLRARPGVEIEVRDGPEEFAATVAGLLRDRDRAVALGLAGRAFVKRTFSWDAVAARVAALGEAG